MHDCMTQEDAMNMDNKQAAQILIPLRDMMIDQHGCPISDAWFALGKAIDALSAQADGDLISRQAAIDAIEVLCQEHRYKIPGEFETYSQYNEAWQDALDRAEGAIGNLPSAQQDSCKGCKHMGLWENEVEYGYPSPCTRCKRRASDNYER